MWTGRRAGGPARDRSTVAGALLPIASPLTAATGALLATLLVPIAFSAPATPTASPPPTTTQPQESDAIPVRVSEGTNFAVAASPDGGTLVFDLQGTLWRLPAAGGEAEPLTDGLGDDRLPDFHPDGSRVVFQSYRSGTWDLWALTLPPETPGTASDTAPEAAPDPAPPTAFPAPERLTDSAGDDREPAWSPDGTRIAFASDRGGTYDLWLLTVETGELRQITTALGNESEPAWTPDSAALVYVAVPEGEADGALHHLTLDPPGTPPVPIPGTAGKVAAPAPGPDGRRVAFRRLHYEGLTLMGSRFDLGTASDLALVPLPPPGEPDTAAATDATENTPAPEPRLLDDAGDDLFPFRPQWADADTLLYTADGAIRRLSVPEPPPDPTEPEPAATPAPAPETIPFTAELTVRRPPRRHARLRTEADEPLPVRGVIRPSLSPDGKTLLYAALGDLWTLPLDTGDAPQAPRPLTRDTWEDTDPLWAPDGRSVLFASDRRGSMDLWEKRLDSAPGAGLTQLTSRLGAETAPALSPDGRRLAYLDEAGNLRLTTRDPDRAPTPTTTTAAAAPTPIPDDQILYLGRRGLGMPSWSSDNETIALAALTPFSSRFREGHNRITLVSATTGEARLLDAPTASVGTRDADGPVFSPDGRALAFALDGGLSVLPVDPQGVPEGEPRRLFTGPADFLSWAPDGRSLLALSGARLLRIPTDAAAPTEPAAANEPAANAAPEEIRLRHTFPVPPPAGRLLLTGVRVLAPEGDRLLPDREVLIEAGRIVSVTEAPAEADPDAPFDEDLRVLHLPGVTLIPGLIEMHTHPMGAAFGNRFGRAHLVYGITSVRITAAAPYRAVAEREAILAGRRVGPRLFLTGATLDGSRIYYPGSAPAGGGVAMDAAFRQTEELDYDLLKTYVRLDDASQREAIRRAHRRGVFVTSHEIYPAVRYGVDGIEHLKGTSRRGFSPKITDLGRSYGDVRALLSRSGVFFTPTLLIYGGWDLALAREPALLERDRRIHALPPWLAARLVEPPEQTGDPESRRALMRPMWDTVAAVAAAGGRIVGGTDTPIVPYGLGLILELEQLAEAGLGAAGALRTATTAAAEALGLSGELGVIAPGAVADLVLLDGDPLEDPRNLRRVRAVLSNGRLATLDQLLSR